jgi:dihydroorotase (multifunctional complex type)
MSLLVRGGKAFVDGKFIESDILIEEGKISRVGENLSGDEYIDAKGMLVLPGLIDPHVHLREPGATQKEDFKTGSQAAIAGGFTTVLDMPNNPIPTTTKERYDEKIRLAKEKAICDVGFFFGGTDDNFDEVKKTDPPFMKLYLGKTTGELLLKKPDSVRRHFESFPKDRPIVLHACHDSEDEEENLRETYEIQERAIALALMVGRRIHIAHASTKKELTLAHKYPNVTAEVAPHHLFLSDKDIERLDGMQYVYPPLRSEQKRLMLLSAATLADCIATDHAPHTVEEKEDGAAGFPGLETSLALMFNACEHGFLDKIWVVQRMSEKPAELFNLKGKGKLEPGFAGDVTIVDHKKEWEVDPRLMYSKCKWSPYEGMKLKGKVHTVIRGGKVVFEEYKII